MMETIDLHGCMWIFSVVCLVGAFVTVVFIPETKGKNLIVAEEVRDEESSEMLEKGKHKIEIVNFKKI